MNANDPIQELHKKGIIFLDSPYTASTIEKWNQLLDPVFKQREQSRSYVNAAELNEMGILKEVFSPAIQNLFESILPDSVIYHCHVYETAANQTVSHIHQGSNLGWHRDEECMVDFKNDDYNFLSYFIYLTEVKEESGPFEFAPYTPTKSVKNGMPTMKVVGNRGTAFIWNRAYRHRACPNMSNTRRRLLKISIQKRYLQNIRINLPEFTEVQKKMDDTFIKNLFSSKSAGKIQPAPPTEEINLTNASPNARLEVSPMGLLKINYIKPIYNRLKEKLGQGTPE